MDKKTNSIGESILGSIRKMIGGMAIPDGGEGPFDTDLIIHINSVLQTLNQLGCGVEDFEITGPNETWSDFIGDTFINLNWVKSYVYLKVKLLFDPPSSSTLHQAMTEQAAELEWRINCKVDRGRTESEKRDSRNSALVLGNLLESLAVDGIVNTDQYEEITGKPYEGPEASSHKYIITE